MPKKFIEIFGAAAIIIVLLSVSFAAGLGFLKTVGYILVVLIILFGLSVYQKDLDLSKIKGKPGLTRSLKWSFLFSWIPLLVLIVIAFILYQFTS